MTVTLTSRQDLTLSTLRRVAWAGEDVAFSQEALVHMAVARQRFMRLLEDPAVSVYGVTSGYGQNARVRLTPEQRALHARRPPIQQAAGWGDPLPDRVTRAIIFARLANFVDGGAAISPAVAQAVACMLDGRPLPTVPTRGQGGAGEILSLSHLFGALAQSAPVAEKDVISLINGSPAASALVADAALAAGARLPLAVEIFALAAEAFNTPLTHFDPTLGELWNTPHDAWALVQLNAAVGAGHGGARRPYQAPVSFRILPRMLGQARRTQLLAAEVAGESLAAVTDNPVMLPPDAAHPDGRIISTGGYHNPYAVMAMDAVTVANANLIVLAGRMAAKLLDGHVSLQADQFGLGGTAAYLGCLPMAITGYEEEARLCAMPTLLPGSESGGFGQDDVASPVFPAWSKQDRSGSLLEAALASLAFIAVRGLDRLERPVPPALAGLAAEVRRHLPDVDTPQALGPAAYGLEAELRRRVFTAP
jgi:histidine ammonia-lyase